MSLIIFGFIICRNRFYKVTSKWTSIKMPAHNEHIGEIAAVSPQQRQCEFGSYYPARTFVKPLPRQYATTLQASREAQCNLEEKGQSVADNDSEI